MRISELADATGVSIATLKYYLREGLLHPGRALGATRADYDDTHVERVRLVRTLIDVGRLSIDRAREVVTALDVPPASRHLLLGTAHDVLRPKAGEPPSEAALARIAALGLPDCAGSPASTQLAQALTSAEAAGWSIADSTLSSWYAAMTQVADADVVPELAAMSPGDALHHAIIGNVLTDPVVIALRRVAQEALSAQRFEQSRS